MGLGVEIVRGTVGVSNEIREVSNQLFGVSNHSSKVSNHSSKASNRQYKNAKGYLLAFKVKQLY